jgi:RNA polymerase sigma-70 factor (ECF subfamily)
VGATPDTIALEIERARRHDRAAFESLYERTLTPVYRYIAARVDRMDEVEELTQEVFLAALRGMHGFRGDDEAALYAWLFQIARHKLADRLRERYRHPESPLDQVDTVTAPQPGPAELAITADEQAAVRAALQHLTDDQREVIVCKYILGFDNAKTGKIVGKNSNAVNQLHHRALAALQRLLAPTQAPTPSRGTRL